MSLRKPGRGTRAPHGRGVPVQCAIARVTTYFGTGRHKLCEAIKRDGTPCRKIALGGASRCGAHGGFGELAKRGLYRAKRS